MKRLVEITVDLDDLAFLKIDGKVTVYFPSVGPLMAVRDTFYTVTVPLLTTIWDAREEVGKRQEAEHASLMEEWRAQSQEKQTKTREEFDKQWRENHGKT